MEKNSLKSAWLEYAIRLAMIIPQDGIARLEGRDTKKRGIGFDAFLLISLIGILALASITNLQSRAYMHKPGIAAYFAGFGLALLVPVVVHFTVKGSGKIAAACWVIVSIFAAISASIQYQVYAPGGDFAFDADHLEALAFGAGVPLAECLLAVILSMVVIDSRNKIESEKAELKAEKEAEEERIRLQKIEGEERKRKQEIEDQERERQRQIEDQRRQDERQEKRLRFEAEIEERRIKAEAAAQAKVLREERKSVAGATVQHSVAQSSSAPDLQQLIVAHLQQSGDTGATDMARLFDVDRSTVYRKLKSMEKSGIVHKNGNGYEVNQE